MAYTYNIRAYKIYCTIRSNTRTANENVNVHAACNNNYYSIIFRVRMRTVRYYARPPRNRIDKRFVSSWLHLREFLPHSQLHATSPDYGLYFSDHAILFESSSTTSIGLFPVGFQDTTGFSDLLRII